MKKGRMILKGFTLLEMLFVVVIIGVLSAIVGPRYFEQLMKTENNAAISQLSSFRRALDVYLLDNGYYPTTEQGLQALLTAPEGALRWAGPYLEKQSIPVDPWGRSYVYSCPSMASHYQLYSKGRNENDPSDDIDISAAAESQPGSTPDATGGTGGTTGGTGTQTGSTSLNPLLTASVDPQGFTDVVGIIQ